MVGISRKENDEKSLWHARVGDFLGDNHKIPGVILCALGIVAVALTLTAAGYGYEGWAIICGITAAALWLTGIAVVSFEHRGHGRMDIEHGRLSEAGEPVHAMHFGHLHSPWHRRSLR
ncbi:hypothetical protein ACFVMC_14530 [Nocardia sp. NPDC127579]|uniref:hypothetical protein n=1 Tax=Nocardia sp. NPDC127579 TaxID=3345402 RepID=UPI00363534CE